VRDLSNDFNCNVNLTFLRFIAKTANMKALTNRFEQSKRYSLNWEDYFAYDDIVKFLKAEADLDAKHFKVK